MGKQRYDEPPEAPHTQIFNQGVYKLSERAIEYRPHSQLSILIDDCAGLFVRRQGQIHRWSYVS